MKLNIGWLNCKKQLITKRTKNKRNCNYKNEDQIQPKKVLKSNDEGLNKKINSN